MDKKSLSRDFFIHLWHNLIEITKKTERVRAEKGFV